jgi:uncharacterized LabA/DUF88 family protein
MLLLIDFDNIPVLAARRGVVYVIEQAIQRAVEVGTPHPSRAHARLYGGWYEHSSLTHAAQALTAEIAREFPRAIPIPLAQHPIRTSAELALSLLCTPADHIFATYRRKEMPRNLRVEHPRALGCQDSSCPLVAVHHFVTRQTCPQQNCSTNVEGLIYRGQQKMVDTMLAADMLSWEPDSAATSIVLVANDHDYWPPTQAALKRGTTITQVDPLPTRRLPEHYARLAGQQFRWTPLS